MKLSIRHQLSIGIGEGLSRAALHLLLTPQNHPGQVVREWTIEAPGIDGAAGFVDAYGNRAHLVTQTKPEAELIVTASGIVETTDRNGVIGRLVHEQVPGLFLRVTDLTKPDPALIEGLPAGGRIALLHELMQRLGEAAEAATETTEAEAPEAVVAPTQSQSQGPDVQMQSQGADGQTQSQSGGEPEQPADRDGETPAAGGPRTATDLAHAFIGAARALRIPARYVTGYCAGADGGPATFHGWAEAYDEGLGWIGFDPSLQICPVESHVRVAIGLDAVSAAAVRAVPGAEAATLGLSIEIG